MASASVHSNSGLILAMVLQCPVMLSQQIMHFSNILEFPPHKVYIHSVVRSNHPLGCFQRSRIRLSPCSKPPRSQSHTRS